MKSVTMLGNDTLNRLILSRALYTEQVKTKLSINLHAKGEVDLLSPVIEAFGKWKEEGEYTVTPHRYWVYGLQLGLRRLEPHNTVLLSIISCCQHNYHLPPTHVVSRQYFWKTGHLHSEQSIYHIFRLTPRQETQIKDLL